MTTAGQAPSERGRRVLVLGASGGVGRHLLRLACDRGHAVTAVVRHGEGLDRRARIVVDDVARSGCLDTYVAGHDVVLSALGLKRVTPANPWSALASPADFSSRVARRLVYAMHRHGVRRVIAVSAAGVGDSAPGMNWLMQFFVATSNVGVAYRDLAVMEQVYAGAGIDWCCPRPTRLTNGPLTQRVSVIDGFPMSAAISRADVAWWMLEHLDGTDGLRTPTITAT